MLLFDLMFGTVCFIPLPTHARTMEIESFVAFTLVGHIRHRLKPPIGL